MRKRPNPARMPRSPQPPQRRQALPKFSSFSEVFADLRSYSADWSRDGGRYASTFAADLAERFRSAHAKPTYWRLFLVWAILLLFTGLLCLNLLRIQVWQSSDLLKQARAQQTTFLRPFIPRRPITDRMGNVLAIDRPVFTLYAHPVSFKEPKTVVAEKLSSVLAKPASDILQQLNSGDSGVRLEYSLSENAADRLQNLTIDGLELAQQQQRLYPQQNIAADVVGYVDVDQQGQAGIEHSHKNLLERSVKSVRLTRTGQGTVMPDRVPGGFLHIDNLHLQLTIDSRIQRAALSALQGQLKKFDAKRGVVMVMDAKDGGIRALIADPSYDPNEYFKAKVELFKNWALTDLYEPGSTFKPLNVAIALEAGTIQPSQVFNDEGAITLDKWPIQNFDYNEKGARGPSTVTQILERSSNVGMVRIAQTLKPAEYYSWLQKIGLGQATGTDLPFEIAGQLKDQGTFVASPVDQATTAFGQGFSITALQLMQLHGLLASGGKRVVPHVVEGLYDDNGQPYWQPPAIPPQQVFSPQTAQTVLQMMESVVQNGSGKSAQIPGYRIGGKTGTAQKAGDGGGYIEGAKITSFVSVFPIDDPRYVVAAVIDEPKGEDAFGSTVAAPIVKTVMEALIAIDKLPPTQPIPTASPTATPASSARE
jgi:cell division protein FtsI (penicillin-binding protein 3)